MALTWSNGKEHSCPQCAETTKEVRVTSAQVHAARGLVERAQEKGEEVSPNLLKIANAKRRGNEDTQEHEHQGQNVVWSDELSPEELAALPRIEHGAEGTALNDGRSFRETLNDSDRIRERTARQMQASYGMLAPSIDRIETPDPDPAPDPTELAEADPALVESRTDLEPYSDAPGGDYLQYLTTADRADLARWVHWSEIELVPMSVEVEADRRVRLTRINAHRAKLRHSHTILLGGMTLLDLGLILGLHHVIIALILVNGFLLLLKLTHPAYEAWDMDDLVEAEQEDGDEEYEPKTLTGALLKLSKEPTVGPSTPSGVSSASGHMSSTTPVKKYPKAPPGPGAGAKMFENGIVFENGIYRPHNGTLDPLDPAVEAWAHPGRDQPRYEETESPEPHERRRRGDIIGIRPDAEDHDRVLIAYSSGVVSRVPRHSSAHFVAMQSLAKSLEATNETGDL